MLFGGFFKILWERFCKLFCYDWFCILFVKFLQIWQIKFSCLKLRIYVSNLSRLSKAWIAGEVYKIKSKNGRWGRVIKKCYICVKFLNGTKSRKFKNMFPLMRSRTNEKSWHALIIFEKLWQLKAIQKVYILVFVKKSFF